MVKWSRIHLQMHMSLLCKNVLLGNRYCPCMLRISHDIHKIALFHDGSNVSRLCILHKPENDNFFDYSFCGKLAHSLDVDGGRIDDL